ncbi:hypothetical protein MMC19_001983 [Ptychographa xylographoides]|nr:hypothetical protein [Ptychographa xylographoides]
MSNQSGGGMGSGPGPQGGQPYGSGSYGESQSVQGSQGGSYNPDFSGAMQHAQQHSQQYGGGDPALYQNAIDHLNNNHAAIANSPVDMGQIQSAHTSLYPQNGSVGGNSGQQHNAQSLGMGAAMQAMHQFAKPSGGQSGGQSGGGGGGFPAISSLMGGSGGGAAAQNPMVGMAIAEAEKLFNSSNTNVAPGTSQQSVVTSAAEQAFKMYMNAQSGGGGGAGGGAGSGMMSLVGKLL